MAAKATLAILAACFLSYGILAATALECSGAAVGFATGKQTCTSSGPDFGKSCMKTEISSLVIQGCDGSPDVPSLCELAGNPTTCCKIAASGQKIICNASDFSNLVSAVDFENCTAVCRVAPPSSTQTTTSIVGTSTSTATSHCVDDTAALSMFGQMPEPKCRFLVGQMSFGCNWTLSRIQQDCPACPYNYTGKDMSTKLMDVCKNTCGNCQTGVTTTSIPSASFLSGSIVSVPSLIGMALIAGWIVFG